MKRKHPKASLLLSAAFALSLPLVGACAKPAVVPDSVELPQAVYTLIAGDAAHGSVKLEPVAMLEKAAIAGASFTYEAADPAVVSVGKDGVVTALSAGRTTVSATFVSGAKEKVSASCELLVYGEATAEEINSFEEEFVNKFGRIEYTAGALDLDNVAAGVEVAFYGTALKAKFTAVEPIYGHIFVDGVSQGFGPFRSGDEIVLAENLPEGVHTVRIVKSSEVYEGRLTVNAFYADRFLKIPERGGPRMEFIGDSITCGFGNLLEASSGALRAIDNSDACLAYSYLTADMLDARYSVVSYSGICVAADGYDLGVNMKTLHTYASFQTKRPYEYDRDMDVVVLALGTNDASAINLHKYTRAAFKRDYAEFLTHLREIYPKAHIVCVYGMASIEPIVNTSIKDVITELGDAKITFKRFSPNANGLGGHPYKDAHAAYAKQLSSYISELLES